MSRSSVHWSIPLAVAALAVLPRLGPALRAYNPSNDAAEHVLIARSLATGQGFVLPIKVRFGRPGPAVHSGYEDRAPLFPLLLSLPVRGDLGPGWPKAWLQLLGVGLAALCALLATLLTADLARRRGIGGRTLGWTALLGGLAVAWLPSLVRASIHLWAEPLGLLIVLAAVRCGLGLWGESGSGAAAERSVGEPSREPSGEPSGGAPLRRAIALGLLIGLARFARPECWVLVPLVPALLLLVGRRRAAGICLAVALALNAIGIALTGVLAPQLGLLSVVSYGDLMTAAPAPRVTALDVVGRIAQNVAAQLWFAVLPKNGFLIVPLALLAARRREARPFLTTALALFAATAVVWSTSDPSRFTIAPLTLLAPVAAVELQVWRRWLAPGNAWGWVLVVAAWCGVFAQRGGKEAREDPPPAVPAITAPGEAQAPVLRDPWSYALVTGRPAFGGSQE